MYHKNLYEYRGVLYTMSELVRMSNLHRDTILRRLDKGWTVEEAIGFSDGKKLPMLSRSDIGKKVPIVFTSQVPVIESMQPVLGKQYTATICGSNNHTNLCRVFFIVELENGKKLITYPGEFQIQEKSS